MAYALSLIALAASVVAQTASSNTITSAASTAAAASGSVVGFTFPGGLDSQTFVGSLVGTGNSLTTFLLGCSPDTPTSVCDFYPPVFVTANPSTLIAQWTYGTEYTETYSCAMSTGGATCVDHATGISADFVTQTTGTASLTAITSASSTDVYNATDILTAPVTLITGNASGKILGLNLLTTNAQGSTVIIVPAAAATNGTASTSSSRNSTVASTSRSSGSTSMTTYHPSASSASLTQASASASTSSSSNVAALVSLAPGFFGATLLGLAAILL